ncbi:hypothetical protein SY88_16370 [Clostridiales bacterium PH28_bin88]|nr:hypothetical protein SY88_16370 [Clostridiales bacterium PH28_bin88]
MEQTASRGIMFNIQKYSIHDGPGIRTLVFLKGCPLRCIWCCNPESQFAYPEFGFYPNRCIGCRACISACDRGAIRELKDGSKFVEQEKCVFGGKCSERCYAEALVLFGKYCTVEEVMKEIEADRPYYEKSGGGVTLSGGEPMLQANFACQLLQECQRRAIHTAIETSGYARWEKFEKLLPYADLVLYDIKHMDPTTHRKLTGVSNETILENARRIMRSGKKLIPRFPIVPGCNDTEENIVATGKFVTNELGLKEIHLLPYHRLGQTKYERLYKDYSLVEVKPFTHEQVNKFKKTLEGFGLNVQVGG